MHNDDPVVFSGAQQIISQCLGLTADQELLVFVDETTVEVGQVIAEAAYSLNIPHMLIFIPVAIQQRIPHDVDLSLLTRGAAREARAILTCVTSSRECLPFRERILETNWSARKRIGHMPGASLDVLRIANIEFEQQVADCHNLELAMARGRDLTLSSRDRLGTVHTLTVDIGGWERLPVASDGVINNGVWGNVPSGETYIAPVEGSAQGSIIINGSLPGLVIQPEDEFILHFKDGHVTDIEPNENPAVRHLMDSQIGPAQAQGDRNWSNLAEIGIGTNPAVGTLTGSMLFDEKAANTAHIALGSSTFMGGEIDSSIHCDMVVREPTISIDGKVVLDQGRMEFEKSEWREDYTKVSLVESPLRTATIVARSGVEADASEGDRLRRSLRSGSGRNSGYLVGNDATAELAAKIFEYLSLDGDWIPVERLAEHAGIDPKFVRRILHVMWEYDLIKVS